MPETSDLRTAALTLLGALADCTLPADLERYINPSIDRVHAALAAEATQPPPDLGRIERERDSLARRCAVRFEETEAALAVVRRLHRARWVPDLDAELWWRGDLRASEPITSAEMAALRRALSTEDDDD